MEDILILLMIIQAIFMVFGYFALVKQIKSTKKRMSTLLGLITLIPIIGFVFGILPSGITAEEITTFLIFYFYSIIANSITCTIVEAVEHLLGGK